jgi:hypothetical protein
MSRPPNETLNAVLKQSTGPNKWVGKFVALMEGAKGVSRLKFVQDTLVALFPKLLISRSLAEVSETTFLELMESCVIYFSMPFLAERVAKGSLRNLHPDLRFEHGEKLLTTPIANLKEYLTLPPKTKDALTKELYHQVLATKAGIILSTLGVTLIGGEYLINYAKNLMTAKVFKKDNFSDIVNLSKGSMVANRQSPVEEKAKSRIKECIALCGGVTLAAIGLAKFGPRLPAKGLELLEKAVHKFDFNYSANGSYGLSKTQLRAYMMLSIPAYVDAARDKLELVEVLSRLAPVMGYLAFGQEILEKGLLKLVGNKFKGSPNRISAVEGNNIRPLEDIAQEAVNKAKRTVSVFAFDSDVCAEAAKTMNEALGAKNILFVVPLAVGILGTGVMTGLLNNFWTAYRYKQANGEAPLPPRSGGSWVSELFTKISDARAGKDQPPSNPYGPSMPAIHFNRTPTVFPPYTPTAGTSPYMSRPASPSASGPLKAYSTFQLPVHSPLQAVTNPAFRKQALYPANPYYTNRTPATSTPYRPLY